jgi:hypothetical protein
MQRMGRARVFAIASALLFLSGCKKPAGDAPAPGASAAESTATGVRFTRKVQSAGNVALVESTLDMKMSVKTKQGQTQLENRQTSKRKRTVLKDNGRLITELRVSYLDGSSEQTDNGTKRKLATPLNGKTYLVKWDGKQTSVSSEAGKTATDDERENVLLYEYDVGKQADLASFIPDRPLRVGERFDATAPSVKPLFGLDADDRAEVERASFTFSGTRQEGKTALGVFDATVLLSHWPEGSDMKLRFAVSGKLSVDLETAWVRELTMEGPIVVSAAKNAPVELSGSGSFKTARHVKYE